MTKALSIAAIARRSTSSTRRRAASLVLGASFALLSSLATRPAHALPSYAAQTGQACAACHVGSFGPQLTPLGRAFKIGGYTQSGGEGWRAQIPVSGMAYGS
ncbi:MAG TPA: hypothetical protein VMB81_06475, partial [Candidatus Sulfotelmatobacter sp.]|nr:hypothetical protein [Candidatus Sulfotelmatobacter sp.]